MPSLREREAVIMLDGMARVVVGVGEEEVSEEVGVGAIFAGLYWLVRVR